MQVTNARISACILARNEARRIEDALRSLQGWTHETLVIDNESEDGTVAIARRYTDRILSAPRAANFDAARNLAVEHAAGGWLFFLDADERVPPRLGPILRELVEEQGDQFEALLIPFKHFFCGKWIQHCGWSPGLTRPQLLKRGRFHYNERLHTGVQVDGRTLMFPTGDPDLAITHYSFDDLHHYLEKLNRYTDAEAENLLADAASHSWQSQLAHLVHDWQAYYDRGHAPLDGMHGFVLAFMAGFYRFASRAKLWDLRRQRGDCPGDETLPGNLGEMLQFMGRVAQEGADQWLTSSHHHPPAARVPVTSSAAPVPLLWHAPLHDPSGYADEARNFVLALLGAGEPLAVAPARWGEEDAGLLPEVRDRIEAHALPLDTQADLFVSHTLPALQRPSPHARFNIARTMFETDRLPPGCETALNAMDRVWVPSEFNRETFVRSGVDPAKLGVIPGAIDPAPFGAPVDPWPLPGEQRFRFLSLFDWTLHKGWDVLLEAFALEFGDDPEVGLVLKVWSSNHYTLAGICSQADAFLRERFGLQPAKAGFVGTDPGFNPGASGLASFPNIHMWWERVSSPDMPRLYRAADAFVLPTRGEGWCRPLMEAMAAGLPTIATAWSGVTAYHSAEVGYPLEYQLVPVPPDGAREIPIYAGHCWAEPDVDGLRRLMRRIVTHSGEARLKGQAAQQHVTRYFSRPAVACLLRQELAHCRALMSGCGARGVGCRVGGNEEHELAAAGQDGAGRAPGVESGSSVPAPCAPHSRPAALPFKPNAHPLPRDPVAPVDFRARLGRPLRVRWEGDQSLLSSLALVNRQFCLGLLGSGDVELTLVEGQTPWHRLSERDDPRFGPLFARRGALLSGPPDVTIRHRFPPDWSRPEKGRLVVIQPWEYGHLPRDWVAAARGCADQVWCYSRFVRDVYIRSGVPAERLRVVPLGFDPDSFTPDGPRFPLPTARSVRFLFVGGALERKGADLLLEAYTRAFTGADDVCLVVKDMGTHTFYQGQTLADNFRRAEAAGRAGAPEVIYLDADLSDKELASLYRACTCVVLPYRGEGFGLPPLEGMACGLPAVVTAGGPTDDFLDDTMALRVPHRRLTAEGLHIGPFECVDGPWQLEPDRDALADALRWVRDHPEETRRRGDTARAYVEAAWTWSAAVAEARTHLLELVAPTPPRPSVPAIPSGDTGSQTLAPDPRTAALPPQLTPVAAPSGDAPSHPSLCGTGPAVELSLCMIARDEEPRIESCLRSIAPYVDEMVVVDTGSADRTREIARECGARVFEFPWTDSFAEARNESVARARGRWIFWMDADDVIAPEAGVELRRLIRRYPDGNAAFQAQVRIPPGPGEFSESVVDHVKLFPNRADLRFEHRIHEQILPAIRRAGLPVLFSEISVTHQHYDRSEKGQARKRQRDFRLLELDLRDRPEHPFVLFNLGMTYLYATKEYEVAAHYLRRSLQASDWRDSIVRKAYAMLSTARICQGEWVAALAANEEGRSYYPEDAELLFLAGQIYAEHGRLDEARRALERLTSSREEPHYRSVDSGLRTYRGRHELALLFRRLGDAPHCERVLREIAAAHPSYLPASVDLVETLALVGQQAEARLLLQQIPALESIRPDLQRLGDLLGSSCPSIPPIALSFSSPAGQPASNGLRRRGGAVHTSASADRPEIQWGQAPEFGRRETLLRALRRLHQLCPGPACIVETGTLRDASPRARTSDGWSTVAWGWYAAQTGGKAYTVDLDPQNMEVCRRVTAAYASGLEYVVADSLRFLREWDRQPRGEIHMLYLDSLDYFEHQREESEAHHRAEAAAALPHLAPRCLVLFDDTSVAAAPAGSPV
jgi:glycosyltransferase involved in cell wall biosynthesis